MRRSAGYAIGISSFFGLLIVIYQNAGVLVSAEKRFAPNTCSYGVEWGALAPFEDHGQFRVSDVDVSNLDEFLISGTSFSKNNSYFSIKRFGQKVTTKYEGSMAIALESLYENKKNGDSHLYGAQVSSWFDLANEESVVVYFDPDNSLKFANSTEILRVPKSEGQVEAVVFGRSHKEVWVLVSQFIKERLNLKIHTIKMAPNSEVKSQVMSFVNAKVYSRDATGALLVAEESIEGDQIVIHRLSAENLNSKRKYPKLKMESGTFIKLKDIRQVGEKIFVLFKKTREDGSSPAEIEVATRDLRNLTEDWSIYKIISDGVTSLQPIRFVDQKNGGIHVLMEQLSTQKDESVAYWLSTFSENKNSWFLSDQEVAEVRPGLLWSQVYKSAISGATMIEKIRLETWEHLPHLPIVDFVFNKKGDLLAVTQSMGLVLPCHIDGGENQLSDVYMHEPKGGGYRSTTNVDRSDATSVEVPNIRKKDVYLHMPKGSSRRQQLGSSARAEDSSGHFD